MVESRDVLSALLEMTRRLLEEASLEESLQVVTDTALRLLPADHASIRVLDESRTELLCGARSGAGAGERPLAFRPDEGVIGWVVQHGRSACLPDVRTDPRFVASGVQGFVVGSLVAVPLWSAGRVIGVLSASAAAPGRFGVDDELLASLLANCAVAPLDRARLERLALTDPQTRTFNRRYLAPRLITEIEVARRTHAPLCVLLLDIDHFKAVNDRHGHDVGDRVLSAVAEILQALVRRGDVLARRGGDEFVVLLPGADAAVAGRVAERIRERVASTPLPTGHGDTLRLGVSIGLARWDGAESAEALERRADAAMYEAKSRGRNRVAVAACETA